MLEPASGAALAPATSMCSYTYTYYTISLPGRDMLWLMRR